MATHYKSIGYHVNATSLLRCPRTLILRKITPNPKGRKPFLKFFIMHLTKCLSM